MSGAETKTEGTMSEWKECELSQIAEVQTGPFGSQLKNEQYITGGTPVITVEHINNFRITDFDYPSVTKEDKKRLSKYSLKTGDIIFIRVGSVDLSAFVQKHQDGWMFSSRMLRVRPNQEVDSRFLSYFFQQKRFREYILNISVGATMPSINTEILKGIPVSYPTLPKQKAIAEVLSSLEDKIDLLHRQNLTLEQMAETLFRQWFVEEAKEDWKIKRLEEILTVSSSKRIFYKEYVDSGIPFYRSKEVIELSNGGTTSTELFISEERFNEIDSKFGSPKKGDILLTSVGTLGVSYRVRKNDKFYFKDGNLTWFSNFGKFPSSIIFCWLNSSYGKEAINNISIGSTQSALTISGLRQIEIVIPPEEIIQKLNSELEGFYKKIEFNQKQIRTLEKMRDTLLPKLMSGGIKLKM